MIRKLILSAVLVIFALGLAVQAQTPVYVPIYWILGNVEGEEDLDLGNRLVMVYEEDDQGEVETLYGYGYTAADGSFSANPFLVGFVEVGRTYKVAVGRGADNYGTLPADVTISGIGYDRLDANLVLGYGLGPLAVDVTPVPVIRIWFGNRLYHPGAYDEDNPFVIPPDPEIRAEISIGGNCTLSGNIEDYSISVDGGTPFALSGANMVSKALALAGGITSFTLQYDVPEDQGLEAGSHVFLVSAKSSGAEGPQETATQLATVEVMGGPLRLVGQVLVFPSPFSIRRDGTCTFQYTLSADANIEIYIYSVAGQIVKRLTFNAGSEGGNTGANKVTWDGRTETGLLAGNAVYVGTLVSRDDKKLLGRFKFSILD